MTGPLGAAGRDASRFALAFAAALLAIAIGVSSVGAATGWTGPRLVGPADNCFDVAAAIDSTGGYHVAAECDGSIRYSSSRPDGTWSTTFFAHPVAHGDHQPQISIDGNVVYVGYTREGFAGCGYDWAGVYYRKRTLPNGAWSAATRLGLAGDHLHSLRVVGGTIHATVDTTGNDYVVSYETSTNGVFHRYVISDATGGTSLRIGNDGRARIAYEAATALRYAVFNGTGFTKSSIPGTTGEDRAPVLVLDASNRAHLLWSHEPGPGCAVRDPQPADGTYYATNRTGSWTPAAARRITTDLGPKSLTMDVATGRVYAVIGADPGLVYYAKTASGPWSPLKLTSARISSCVIRLSSTGTLLVVYGREFDDNISASIYSFTKP